MVKRGIILILIIFLILAIIFALDPSNMTTGKIVKNSQPKTVLLRPSIDEVINQNPYTFKWKFYDSDVGDVQTAFEIQIADNNQLSNAIIKSSITSMEQIGIKLPKGGITYYWRVRTKDAYTWSKWSEIQEFTVDTSKQCMDGTKFGECNYNKKYCDEGYLRENCLVCGCKEDKSCNEISQSCEIISCLDGTKEGTCNIDHKFCSNKILIDNCKKCGCSLGYICESDECIKSEVIKKDGIFIKIFDFIKNTF